MFLTINCNLTSSKALLLFVGLFLPILGNNLKVGRKGGIPTTGLGYISTKRRIFWGMDLLSPTTNGCHMLGCKLIAPDAEKPVFGTPFDLVAAGRLNTQTKQLEAAVKEVGLTAAISFTCSFVSRCKMAAPDGQWGQDGSFFDNFSTSVGPR